MVGFNRGRCAALWCCPHGTRSCARLALLPARKTVRATSVFDAPTRVPVVRESYAERSLLKRLAYARASATVATLHKHDCKTLVGTLAPLINNKLNGSLFGSEEPSC